MLGYRLRGISFDIAPCDAAGIKIILVQIVCSRSCDAYQFQAGGAADSRFIYRDLIYYNDIRVCNPFRNFSGQREGVSGDSAESVEYGQVDIFANRLYI